MGDVLVVSEPGRASVTTFDNRCPPQRIEREGGVIVSIGAPVGDVGRLGDALLRGDDVAAKAAALDLDGHFAVFAVSADRAAAATDSAGAIPVYFHTAPGRTVLGTRVNEVAEAARAHPDRVSVYDFAIHRAICHPFTWFEDVFVCEPASIISAKPSFGQEAYWTPADETRADWPELVPVFQQQMQAALAEAASELAGLLMSAGEDSRAVAAFLPRGARVQGYIFLDALNREWAFADMVAKVMSIPLAPLLRETRDAAALLSASQNLVGLGYDTMQMHVLPFADRIPERRLMGGWTSDTLFKGYFLRPRAPGRFPQRSPKMPVAGPASEELHARYVARHAALLNVAQAPAYEWLRMWPLSAHQHFAHYASARRLFDHREPFFYAKTYRLSARIRPKDKHSRRFFYEATNPALGLASWLPTGRGSVPAMNGEVPEMTRRMVRWHDRHMNPGVAQSAWGRSVLLSECDSYPALSNAVEAGLAGFDDGALSRLCGPAAAHNRLVQIGYALHRGSTRRIKPHAA